MGGTTPVTNTSEPFAGDHTSVHYSPDPQPLSINDVKFFENPPYDGSLEYDEVVEKEKLDEFVSRLIVTDDWSTYKTYFRAMDKALKWHMEHYVNEVLANPTLVPSLNAEDLDRLRDWSNQDLAMNGVLASGSVWAWTSDYSSNSRFQLYDGSDLYLRTEAYDSFDWGPGSSQSVRGLYTDNRVSSSWYAGTNIGGYFYDYSDDIHDVYADGTEDTSDDTLNESTASFSAKAGGSYEELNGKHAVDGGVSASFRTNPAPNRSKYSFLAHADGSIAGDALPDNGTKKDLSASVSLAGEISQNEPPSDSSLQTKESIYARAGVWSQLKINERWGVAVDVKGETSDWVSNYSLGSETAGNFYIYGQYSPPEKKNTTDEAEKNQPLISTLKLGVGGDLADNHYQSYGVDEVVDDSKYKTYIKMSLATNEKKDWSFYTGAKPLLNFSAGTNNGVYPSLSTWAGTEFSPGFHSFWFELDHYTSVAHDIEYVHTDPNQIYYYPEGFYSWDNQELSASFGASVAPISRLNLNASASVSQTWASGDMSPTDDTWVNLSGGANWLIKPHRPDLTVGINGNYSHSTAFSAEVPTTDMLSNSWDISVYLSTNYIRLDGGANNAKRSQ